MGMSTYLFLAFTMAMNIQSMEMRRNLQIIEIQSAYSEEGLFLGNGMSGVVITLNSGLPRSDLRHYISYLDGSHGSVETLVPALGTSPLNSLFDVVGSEYAIDHRDACIEANRSNPF